MYHINTERATSSFKDSDFETVTDLEKTWLCSTAALDKLASLISPPHKSHSVWFLHRRACFLSLSFFFPASHGLWDLSSLTRDQTWGHGSESLTTGPQVSPQRGHSPIQPQCCHQNQDTETSVSLPPKAQTPSPVVCCPPGLKLRLHLLVMYLIL